MLFTKIGGIMDSVLMENAKKMLDSGISKEEVTQMLISLGYNEKEVKSAIDSNGSASNTEVAEEAKKEVPKEDLVVEESTPVAEKPTTNAKDYAEQAELASNLAMNVVDNATKQIEENKEGMQNLNNNINRTYEKLDSVSFDKMDSFHKDIAQIKLDLASLVAKTNVNIDLMKKILENQRELIMKLN